MSKNSDTEEPGLVVESVDPALCVCIDYDAEEPLMVVVGAVEIEKVKAMTVEERRAWLSAKLADSFSNEDDLVAVSDELSVKVDAVNAVKAANIQIPKGIPQAWTAVQAKHLLKSADDPQFFIQAMGKNGKALITNLLEVATEFIEANAK